MISYPRNYSGLNKIDHLCYLLNIIRHFRSIQTRFMRNIYSPFNNKQTVIKLTELLFAAPRQKKILFPYCDQRKIFQTNRNEKYLTNVLSDCQSCYRYFHVIIKEPRLTIGELQNTFFTRDTSNIFKPKLKYYFRIVSYRKLAHAWFLSSIPGLRN